MKILFINPNSSELVTDALEKEIKRIICNSDLEVDVVTNYGAPKGIVSSYDILISAETTLDIILEYEDNYDAAIIGCFADPGLDMAKELSKIKITGLLESSLLFSKILGKHFSIIASGDNHDIGPFKDDLRRLGYDANLVSIEPLYSTVEGAVNVEDEKLFEIIKECNVKKGAEVVILGCAAFAGKAKTLSEKTGVTVIDGVAESINLVEMMKNYYRRNINER